MALPKNNAPKRCNRNCQQCRPWSDCSSRSSLIWVCTVCPDLSVWKLRNITVNGIPFMKNMTCITYVQVYETSQRKIFPLQFPEQIWITEVLQWGTTSLADFKNGGPWATMLNGIPCMKNMTCTTYIQVHETSQRKIFPLQFPEQIWINEVLQVGLILKPEAHGPQCSPECTAMKAIFSQNTVNVACHQSKCHQSKAVIWTKFIWLVKDYSRIISVKHLSKYLQ